MMIKAEDEGIIFLDGIRPTYATPTIWLQLVLVKYVSL
jgi:hypothetical protein